MLVRMVIRCLSFLLACCPAVVSAAGDATLDLATVDGEATTIRAEIGSSGTFTWWLPDDPDTFVLPISGGVVVESARTDRVDWLRRRSPWSLNELPAFGLRYGARQLVVIVPWPHYAELVIGDRVGVRWTEPPKRQGISRAEIVVLSTSTDPLQVARAFRRWRREAESIGGLPRPRSLHEKVAELPRVERLFGAPHIYLWGEAAFSRHAVARAAWIGFARALAEAPDDHVAARLIGRFSAAQRRALDQLASSAWPADHLTREVARAIDGALQELDGISSDSDPRIELASAFPDRLGDPSTWGDGPSVALVRSLRDAGVERALLVLSDLYGDAALGDVATAAERLGYLFGPYDSYHSVHSPDAARDETWETAQFDRAAFRDGRILDAHGVGRAGFRNRGYHLAPAAAWPYVQRRVNGLLDHARYTTWFVDCDATAEVFDDYSLAHPATRIEDVELRRRRLRWLESEHRLVVGSEGGSVLFTDVVHFGHGVHTPYIGHLSKAFRDRDGRHFVGRHWPPEAPDRYFRPVPLPAELESPFFDPTMRIPLYQAALGDEVVTTHHWEFGSFKLAGLDVRRQLLEMLYMVPPVIHLNRANWPMERERIVRHLAFWAPLHRLLAPAPLTRFDVLTADRSVQRTTFETADGKVTITVNFSDRDQRGVPAYSARAEGAGPTRLFRAQE
ncbi:MAG: glycoside hydrolase [Acidobacteriota bacterium]